MSNQFERSRTSSTYEKTQPIERLMQAVNVLLRDSNSRDKQMKRASRATTDGRKNMKAAVETVPMYIRK